MKIVNIKSGIQYDIYGGRGSFYCKTLKKVLCTHMNNSEYPTKGWLGNPYSIDECGGRKQCIEKFKIDFYKKIKTNSRFRNIVLGLKDMKVACFCYPLECHLDVIKEYIEQEEKHNGF